MGAGQISLRFPVIGPRRDALLIDGDAVAIGIERLLAPSLGAEDVSNSLIADSGVAGLVQTLSVQLLDDLKRAVRRIERGIEIARILQGDCELVERRAFRIAQEGRGLASLRELPLQPIGAIENLAHQVYRHAGTIAK